MNVLQHIAYEGVILARYGLSMQAAPQTEMFHDVLSNVPIPIRGALGAALGLNGLHHLYKSASALGRGTLAQSVLEEMDIRLFVRDDDVKRIPTTGRTIIVANHPFGMLDGLVFSAILERIRPDFKVVVNEFLFSIPELRDRFLPVDVFGGRAAIGRNAAALRGVLNWLQEDHLIVLFPSGEVSHWRPDAGKVTDPPWNPVAARLAKMTGTHVVPAYFTGGNSVVFQLAGLVHPWLRTARLPAELLNKRGRSVEVRLGSAIVAGSLRNCGSDEEAAAYLRARSYCLQHRKNRPNAVVELPRRTAPVSVQERDLEDTGIVAQSIKRLHDCGQCIADTGGFSVYRAEGRKIPALLEVIGRLRERTFRLAGEGTGETIDVDRFDDYYTHLILWNKADSRIAGAYRLVWTEDVLTDRGLDGLYSSTLFQYSPEFFAHLGPAVELGRSFVRPEYQRHYAALLALWQAIASAVAARPGAPVLFGAVSISASYSEPCRHMMVEFLKHRRGCAELERYVQPRNPFRPLRRHETDLAEVAAAAHEFDELPLIDLQHEAKIPILLKHYLRLGALIVRFNLDRSFSDALDGLIVADLRKTPRTLLSKYMGQRQANSFLTHHGLMENSQRTMVESI